MRRRGSLLAVIAAIVLVLLVLVIVAVTNGADAGGEDEKPTLTPSPSNLG